MSFLLTNPGTYYGAAATIMFISYSCMEMKNKNMKTDETKSSLLCWCIGSITITIITTSIFMSPFKVTPEVSWGVILTCLLTLIISIIVIQIS